MHLHLLTAYKPTRSSTREPTAVFTLLETVYHSFDTIAVSTQIRARIVQSTLQLTHYCALQKRRRRVFKVETVGDCYGEFPNCLFRSGTSLPLTSFFPSSKVAVCGLPIARKDHAVTMCRFASDCLCRMNELTAQLEKSLGPDTADLCLRIGRLACVA